MDRSNRHVLVERVRFRLTHFSRMHCAYRRDRSRSRTKHDEMRDAIVSGVDALFSTGKRESPRKTQMTTEKMCVLFEMHDEDER
jgi:hypothetical protein